MGSLLSKFIIPEKRLFGSSDTTGMFNQAPMDLAALYHPPLYYFAPYCDPFQVPPPGLGMGLYFLMLLQVFTL